MRDYNWKLTVEKGICKAFADFETMTDAKLAKQQLEIEVMKRERLMKPKIGYGLTFSNAYWIQ